MVTERQSGGSTLSGCYPGSPQMWFVEQVERCASGRGCWRGARSTSTSLGWAAQAGIRERPRGSSLHLSVMGTESRWTSLKLVFCPSMMDGTWGTAIVLYGSDMRFCISSESQRNEVALALRIFSQLVEDTFRIDCSSRPVQGEKFLSSSSTFSLQMEISSCWRINS